MIEITDAMVEVAARSLCKTDGTNPDLIQIELNGESYPAWEDYADGMRSVLKAVFALEAADHRGDELEWQSWGRRDVPWDGEIKRCPSCGAGNVSLRSWIDARRWVRCRICRTTGPEMMSDKAAVDGWNKLSGLTSP